MSHFSADTGYNLQSNQYLKLSKRTEKYNIYKVCNCLSDSSTLCSAYVVKCRYIYSVPFWGASTLCYACIVDKEHWSVNTGFLWLCLWETHTAECNTAETWVCMKQHGVWYQHLRRLKWEWMCSASNERCHNPNYIHNYSYEARAS